MLDIKNFPQDGFIVLRENLSGVFEPYGWIIGDDEQHVDVFATEEEAKRDIIEHARDIIEAIDKGDMDVDAFNTVYSLRVATFIREDKNSDQFTATHLDDVFDELYQGSIIRQP